MNVDRAAPLSLLEDLTPKILQHIASYLVRDNTHMQFDIPKIRNQVPVINDALLEFRATSKTINVKTEYSYIKMFESHGTESDPEKVSHLLQISRHTKLAPAVRHLLFTPSGYDKTCLDRSVNWSQNFSHDPKIRSLQGTMSPMKVALVGALKNFSNLNSVSVSWNIDSWFWEESEGILASMVFAAVVSARIPLEMLDLRFPRYECRGGIPTSKFTGLAGAVSHFQNLKVLGLVICHHQHGSFYRYEQAV